MKNYVQNTSRYSITFGELLQLTFIVLKLLKVINWSWWLVLLPTIIPISLLLIVILFWLYFINKKIRRVKNMFNRKLIAFMAFIVFSVILFGFVLPYLISAKSTEAVIVGVCIILIYLYFAITFVYMYIKKKYFNKK